MKTIDIALDQRAATLWFLGRRVERLLVGGAALVALAMVAFYLAYAGRHYAEHRASEGMENLALLIEGDDKVLQRFYDLESQRQKLVAKKKEKDAKDAAPTENFYEKALEDKVVRAAELSGTDAASLRALVSAERAPAELVKSLRDRKKALDDSPAVIAGMTVPSSSLATGLPAGYLAHALILVIAPVVILWLGALRTTRRREQAAIDGDHPPYPHALNVSRLPFESALLRLADARWPDIDWYRVKALLVAVQRMTVAALVVIPVVAAFIAAVTALDAGPDGTFLRALYLVVVMAIMVVQAGGLVLGEGVPSLHGIEEH